MQSQTKPLPPMSIEEILASKDQLKIKALFQFSKSDSDEAVRVKFNLFARYNFSKYFSSQDGDFHKDIDSNNIKAYRGEISSFIDIAFREAAKTARTKLFMGFVILNDLEHLRKYIKVLSADGTNSTQIVTDVYNMLVKQSYMYPEIFEKTSAKREETMHSFTTTTGIKMVADTVGTDQRGAIQEEARPDLIWFEDFENRTTLRSAKKTRAIWENMEEARTSLAKGGAALYTCNYISEQGNVHKLVTKQMVGRVVLITSILLPNGESAWPSRFSKADIEQMRQDDEDFEGERLCKPSAAKDILFDRESLDRMERKTPIKEIAGLKIFKAFDPSHRQASGHDVGGGVGLDSSTSVFIDFDTIPAQVAATFKSDTIKPDTFGDEVARESNIFGGSLAAIEKNNHGHATIARAKQLEVNLFVTPPKAKDVQIAGTQQTAKEYGWHTNAATKPKMIFAFSKAVEDGQIALNDPDLIAEAANYTRNDLIDNETDPRETTRHFDLLTAAAIAWQMKDYAQVIVPKVPYVYEEEKPLYPDIGV